MPTPYEPTWLSDQISRRVAEIRARGAFDIAVATAPIIMTNLTDPNVGFSDMERDRWERTCDNCGRYCPSDGVVPFYTGHAIREDNGRQVLIVYGVCNFCRLAHENNQREEEQ